MIPHDDALIIKHPDTGFISVAGDESCAFLQSIITANVETLPVSACRPSALLTPQGRVLVDMMVYRSATDRFILRCDSKRRDDLFARLHRYRLRRPIEITIEPEMRLFLVMKNKTAAQSESQMRGQILNQLGDSAGVIISSIDPRNPDLGTHILANGDKITATADQIDIWHAARIAAGIPEGAIDLTPERALMLEAGLDQLNAVDFEKGCYVGQEVTARTHYRGLVKRRIVPITITGTPPIVNSDITWNEKVIGNSKTAAQYYNGMAICLALLKLGDIHAILDTGNDKTGNFMVNGNPASLAIPDWMMPLPRPSK
jgi:folate-binding protein YgfZ